MSSPRKVVVLGTRERLIIGVLLVICGAFAVWHGDLVQAGLLFGAVGRSLLPVEKGYRPDDTIKVVTRGAGAVLRGKLPTISPPLPLPPKDGD